MADEIGGLQTKDIGRRPDLLIVMGTSLKVHGLKKLVKDFATAVHNPEKPQHKVVFVNKTPPPAEWSGVFDFWVQGDTDAWVEMVLSDWKKMRPADWEVQQTLEDAGGGKVVKAKSKSSTLFQPAHTRLLMKIIRIDREEGKCSSNCRFIILQTAVQHHCLLQAFTPGTYEIERQIYQRPSA